MSVGQAKWQHSESLGWCRINPFHISRLSCGFCPSSQDSGSSSGSCHSLSVLWDRLLGEGIG